MEINLKLSVEEVNFILSVLGELPTKTGAWQVLSNIKTQADPQVPSPAEETTGE